MKLLHEKMACICVLFLQVVPYLLIRLLCSFGGPVKFVLLNNKSSACSLVLVSVFGSAVLLL